MPTPLRVLAVVVVLATTVLAWPRVLGGGASYIVVSGISMEPGLSTGDLVVTRERDTYEVGDVVAFDTADGQVIHRIVGGDPLAGFVTQGDNVGQVDPYRPVPRDIAGEQVLAVPGVGALGLQLTRVVPAPVLGLLAAAVAVRGERRRRRRRSRPRREQVRNSHDPGSGTMTSEGALLGRRNVRIAAGCALAAMMLLPSAVVAWRTPTTATVAAVEAPVRHVLATTVVGIADGPSDLYPEGRSETVAAAPDGSVPGDAQPLLRALVGEVVVDMTYDVEGADAGDGTASADVVLRTGRGFVLPFDGLDATPFTDGFEGSLSIDLDRVDARMADYLAESGLRGDAVRVEVTPRVVTAAGLVLTGDPLVLVPGDEIVQLDGALTTTTSPTGAETTVTTRVGMLGVPVPTPAARLLAPLAVLALLAVAGLHLRREQEHHPEIAVGLLHGSLLVDIDDDANVGGELVRVASIAELARLARRDQRSILHQRRPDGSHRYMVPDGDLTYEFTIGAPMPETGDVAPDDASTLVDPDVPATPGELPFARTIVVEDFAELSRIWLRTSGAPGRLERRRQADGTIRYAVTRNGREFVHVAADAAVLHGGDTRG